MTIGVVVFPSSGIDKYLADKARKPGFRMMRFDQWVGSSSSTSEHGSPLV